MSCNERLYTVSWGVAVSRSFRSESRSDLVTQWYGIIMLTFGVSHEVMTWGDWGDTGAWWWLDQGRCDRDWLSTTYIRSYYILHQVCHTHHGSLLHSNHRKGVNVLTASSSRDWLDLHKELGTIRELLRANTWSADHLSHTSDTTFASQVIQHVSVHTKVTNITTWWPHIYTHQRLCSGSNWMRQISS